MKPVGKNAPQKSKNVERLDCIFSYKISTLDRPYHSLITITKLAETGKQHIISNNVKNKTSF